MQQHKPPHSAQHNILSHIQQRDRSSGSKPMATKSLLLAALLVLAVSQAPHGAEAGKQAPMAIISGVVPCSAGNSINVAAVPPFPSTDLCQPPY